MLKTDGTVPTMNLFKQKRTKGWWPFYAKDDNDDLLLQVKYMNVKRNDDSIMLNANREK